MTAPEPLTVVAQQSSGEDPLAKKLTYPIVARIRYGADEYDSLNDEVRERITDELKALEAKSLNSSKTGESESGTANSDVPREASESHAALSDGIGNAAQPYDL